MGPIIGITADKSEKRHRLGIRYAESVSSAGGVPLILPPLLSQIDHYLEVCNGFILSGGDDPCMEQWGIPTHENATPVAKERQEVEVALVTSLAKRPNVPVFGICLGGVDRIRCLAAADAIIGRGNEGGNSGGRR